MWKLRYFFSSFWLLFGAVWALVGTPFVIVGLVWGLSEKSLQEHGVPVEGEVVEKYTSRSSEGSLQHKVRIFYTDDRGDKHEWIESVGRSLFEELAEGEVLPLVYDPEDPTRAALGGDLAGHWWIFPLAFGGFGLIFAGVGWFLVFREVPKVLKRISLMEQGWVATGVVQEVLLDYNTRINGRHPLYLLYSFTGPDGVSREGRSVNLPRRLEKRFSPGDSIPVVYDPRNPEVFEADVLGVRSHEAHLS